MSCLQNFILMALFTFLSPKLFAMNDCIESSLQLPITTYQFKNICNVVVKNDICQNMENKLIYKTKINSIPKF